jgi:hypothetical protein
LLEKYSEGRGALPLMVENGDNIIYCRCRRFNFTLLTPGEASDDVCFALSAENTHCFNGAVRTFPGISAEVSENKRSEFGLCRCMNLCCCLYSPRLQPQGFSTTLMKRYGFAGEIKPPG